MFKLIKSKIAIIAAVLAIAIPVGVPALVSAQDNNIQGTVGSAGCSGSNLDLTGTDNQECTTATAGGGINKILTSVINIFSVVVGLIAVIMIIIGGFRYIVSGGESSSVSGAKNAILFAIVGLVIVAVAQLIVHFVLAKSASLT